MIKMKGDYLNYIYLDSNSTTPLEKSVIDVIHKSCIEFWANPSSNSELGKKAKECIDKARRQVGFCVNTEPNNVIFTSGGTESNNMVIQSCVKQAKNSGYTLPHVVTTSVEHDATLECLKNLQKESQIEMTIVGMRKDGSVSSQDILDAVKRNTSLITIMMANNETGVIFPLQEISRGLKLLNINRESSGMSRIFLHTDAAQTIGKLPVDMQDLGVDYITVVGHKFYGPRIGAVCRKDSKLPLIPLFYGGGQEFGLRPGTENTPMIAGLGEACEIIANNINKFHDHMKELSNYLKKLLQERFGEDIIFNFNTVDKIPNTLSVSFVNVSAKELLKECPSVIASTGSACHASSDKLSRVLLESLDEKTAEGTVRLSVGRNTTKEEINQAVALFRSSYLKLNRKTHNSIIS